ncbi:MAG: DUF2157 domain-containing protein [Caldilineaceae bacterium]
MTTELTDLQATPGRLRKLARLGYLDAAALDAGLRRIGGIPDRAAWGSFLDYLLLTLGALFLTSGIFFFVAYNWEDLSRFTRFGLLEGVIVLAVAITHWVGLNRLGGKLALTVATLLVGALLAIFGQEYQTGADSYLLFGNWALLVLGWVLIGNFDLLWAIFLVLLNVTLFLFWNQRYPSDLYPQPESLFALNAVALLGWELAARRWMWIQQRWLPRVTALAAFAWIGWPTLALIFYLFDPSFELALIHRFGPLIYGIFAASVWFVYYRLKPDLFMLTVTLFSVLVVITTLVARALVEVDELLAYFVTSIVVIIQAAVAVGILRRIAHRWEETA